MIDNATSVTVRPNRRGLPERLLPERILRAYLAGAGLRADLVRSGEYLVLFGSQLPGGPLESLLDYRGPGGTVLDEPLAQAACGLMAVHGRARGRRGRGRWGRGRGVARLGVDYVTTAASVVLAQGVLAALLARLRGGPASGVMVSVAATALLTVSQYLAAGTADERDPVARAEPGNPPPFQSLDGVVFELEALDEEPWWRFWTAFGLSDEVSHRSWRPFLLRYSTAVAELPVELHAATMTRSFADLRHAAESVGVAVQPLRSYAQRRQELVGHDPFAASWTIEPNGSARAEPGTGRAGGSGARFGDGPLAGMVVVDAGRRVQGPLAGQLLGQLGAEVVRIEPTGGDPLRAMPPLAGDCSARFFALNCGKRLVEADLWNPTGRAEVLDAVRDADVFLHNWAPGRAARLGLDHDRLAAVNPRLVSAHASGWGDARGTNPPPGTDFMVQAYAGLPDQLTPFGEAPAGSLMTLLDVLGGLVATSGVLAGLLGRERDGRGRLVRSSLLSAADLLLARLLPAELSDRGQAGQPEWGIVGVPLPAADGHLVLSRNISPYQAATALGVGDPVQLLVAVAAQPVARSLALLTAAGVDAVRACADPDELADDPWVATLLQRDRCALVRPPWTFAP